VRARFATEWWHWFFLGNPAAEADRVINADPDAWYHSDGTREQMAEQAWEDYQRAIHDPATVRAMCEDYRAGLGMDRQHDNADLAAGRRLACPVLVVWATRDGGRGAGRREGGCSPGRYRTVTVLRA
jgi:haloacetate dehalogenase